MESLLELLASEGIHQGVHNGAADDEGQEEVEVLEDAVAGGVLRTEDDEKEVQEEGAPAEEENTQQVVRVAAPLRPKPQGTGRCLLCSRAMPRVCRHACTSMQTHSTTMSTWPQRS